MHLELDIKFDQLVQLAKKLPVRQWEKLKQEVDSESGTKKNITDLEAFLLTAPTFTEEQLDEIDKTRKAINPINSSFVHERKNLQSRDAEE